MSCVLLGNVESGLFLTHRVEDEMATHAEPTATAPREETARESLEMENLKKLDTVDALHVDVGNTGALKGDDSDGRVNWTTKQVLATISLSALYVGECFHAHPVSS